MEIEYIYDNKTQAMIDQFKGYIADYEKMLFDKINHCTEFDYMSVCELERSKRDMFLSDAGRINLEKQLAKIFATAIPVKVLFSKAANARI